MKTLSSILALGASLLLVVAVSAADQEKPRGDRPRGERPQGEHRQGPMGMGALEMVRDLDLSAEQKAKVEEVGKELGPKMKEARQKMEAIQKEMAEVAKQIHDKLDQILTADQKEQLKKKMEEQWKKMGERLSPEKRDELRKKFEEHRKARQAPETK